MFSRLHCAAICLLGLALTAKTSAAQEFVRQRLLVHNFDAPRGSLGAKVADAVASQIDHDAKRDVTVINRWDMLQELQKAGYNIDSVLMSSEIREISRRHRADEYVIGKVVPGKGREVRIDGALMLTRDSGLKQPVFTLTLPDADAAAKAFGAEVAKSRDQLPAVRRCENALRAGNAKLAVDAAREGIRSFSRAAIARACLLRAWSALEEPADSVVLVANELIALDSSSWIGWESAAVAHDDLGHRELAGRAWAQVARLQSNDADVVAKVVSALMRDGNAAIAKPIIGAAVEARPENQHLAGLNWRVLLATETWDAAATFGVGLRKLAPTYETQPDYFTKLATAWQKSGQPFRALATAAEGVALHPEDADLYLLYSQLVIGESDTALVRGVDRFPKNGKLLAYDAQLKRKRGDKEGALAATRRAVMQDSSISKGYLQLAQAFLDLKQADSALAALRAGLKTAADTSTVAQFALARGNELYKVANASKKRQDFEASLQFLQLSELLAPGPNAGFLVGSASFGVAQLAAAELSTTRTCALATLAQESLTNAQSHLMTHGRVAPDAAKQFLDYGTQLEPYVTQQFKLLCSAK